MINFVLLAMLTACGDKNEEQDSAQDTAQEEAQEETQEDTGAAEEQPQDTAETR